jgi:hypothetical protein
MELEHIIKQRKQDGKQRFWRRPADDPAQRNQI